MFCVAVCVGGGLGCYAEQLADERIGDAVAVLVQRDDRRCQKVIQCCCDEVHGAVDERPRGTADARVVLVGQDDAGPFRAEQFGEFWAKHGVWGRICGQPRVGAACHARVLEQWRLRLFQ
ncbi:Uncharacterised protein [Mycobacteroides abscessus subsp. abscessus]|nr:Uncharacterised protein [Mycobacteroides abscessus subsp. abscessus]